MILTTTPAIDGHTIREYKGVVFGEVITGVNFLKDFAASIRNFVGGRSESYESELVEARQKAMDEMAQPALRDRIISCKEITEFQKKVYLELLKVPSGQTISYSELARRIGCRSPQAVQALKRNPFAPDVPCHRVIRSDGKLGGYFGKTDGEMTDRKRKLLEAEAQETLLNLQS